MIELICQIVVSKRGLSFAFFLLENVRTKHLVEESKRELCLWCLRMSEHDDDDDDNDCNFLLVAPMQVASRVERHPTNIRD